MHPSHPVARADTGRNKFDRATALLQWRQSRCRGAALVPEPTCWLSASSRLSAATVQPWSASSPSPGCARRTASPAKRSASPSVSSDSAAPSMSSACSQRCCSAAPAVSPAPACRVQQYCFVACFGTHDNAHPVAAPAVSPAPACRVHTVLMQLGLQTHDVAQPAAAGGAEPWPSRRQGGSASTDQHPNSTKPNWTAQQIRLPVPARLCLGSHAAW